MTRGLGTQGKVSRTLLCVKCGAQFIGAHSQSKYCSPECAQLGARDSWNKYAKENKAKRKTYHQGFYSENADAVIQRTRAYHQTIAGKAAQRKTDQRQREINPEKIAARQAVNDAIRSGRLGKQPCARCGNTQVHGHHEDYSRPLDVIWLCGKCHRQRHAEMKHEVAQ